jgi:hypothetical protein
VPTGIIGWNVAQIKVYAYQTGAPAEANTFTKLHVKIYTGDPRSGAPVTLDCSGPKAIDVTTAGVFTNVYRVETIDPQNDDRAVKELTGNLCTPKRLIPGTYWLEWSVEGDALYSPSRANVTVPWDEPDNALQLSVSTGIWSPMIDPINQGGSGKNQDIPFLLHGREAALGIPPVEEGPGLPDRATAKPSPLAKPDSVQFQQGLLGEPIQNPKLEIRSKSQIRTTETQRHHHLDLSFAYFDFHIPSDFGFRV